MEKDKKSQTQKSTPNKDKKPMQSTSPNKDTEKKSSPSKSDK